MWFRSESVMSWVEKWCIFDSVIIICSAGVKYGATLKKHKTNNRSISLQQCPIDK